MLLNCSTNKTSNKQANDRNIFQMTKRYCLTKALYLLLLNIVKCLVTVEIISCLGDQMQTCCER